jgi:small subunit ribosomal protein S21
MRRPRSPETMLAASIGAPPSGNIGRPDLRWRVHGRAGAPCSGGKIRFLTPGPTLPTAASPFRSAFAYRPTALRFPPPLRTASPMLPYQFPANELEFVEFDSTQILLGQGFTPRSKGDCFVVKLTLRDKETAQEAVRRFRKLVERSGIKKEIRVREFYEKPSETRRRARLRAQRRARRDRLMGPAL